MLISPLPVKTEGDYSFRFRPLQFMFEFCSGRMIFGWVMALELVFLYPRSPKGEGVYCFTSVRLSVQDIFLSNCWWQKSDIWSQASYRYPISWEAFLDPSDSYFLFVDLVGFYTHWTYMHIFRHIFLSNYWWQRSDIWSQASYRYPISWEAFFDPSDSYFLFAEERGYHKWALSHNSSCSCKLCMLSLWLNHEGDSSGDKARTSPAQGST